MPKSTIPKIGESELRKICNILVNKRGIGNYANYIKVVSNITNELFLLGEYTHAHHIYYSRPLGEYDVTKFFTPYSRLPTDKKPILLVGVEYFNLDVKRFFPDIRVNRIAIGSDATTKLLQGILTSERTGLWCLSTNYTADYTRGEQRVDFSFKNLYGFILVTIDRHGKKKYFRLEELRDAVKSLTSLVEHVTYAIRGKGMGYSTYGQFYKYVVKKTGLTLFYPSMLWNFRRHVQFGFAKKEKFTLRDVVEYVHNYFGKFHIRDYPFIVERILVNDLEFHGLVKRKKSDKETYWTLTKKGRKEVEYKSAFELEGLPI